MNFRIMHPQKRESGREHMLIYKELSRQTKMYWPLKVQSAVI